jgi:hypothetical protein
VEAAVIFFSSRGVIIGPSLTDSVRIGCLPPLPCRHCVKPANSASGVGRSQLGDWFPQKLMGSGKKCIALLQTLLQGEFKSSAEIAAFQSTFSQHYHSMSCPRLFKITAHHYSHSPLQNNSETCPHKAASPRKATL